MKCSKYKVVRAYLKKYVVSVARINDKTINICNGAQEILIEDHKLL